MRSLDVTGWLNKPVSPAPLAVFRVLFGAVMLFGVIRFAANGWIHELYIAPEYHFTYYGFGWVRSLGYGMYVLFGLMGLSALGILLGWHYRLSALVFFLTFTYTELIDKTYYLNHYYFVSLVALLMIILPAHRHFSLDVRRRPGIALSHIPQWTIFILQLQLALVYFYAGAAKLNAAWMLEAMPLRIWLPPHTDLPLIGSFMDDTGTAYFFSWFGAVYDLTIPFFLWWHKSRPYAYLAVIAFHLFTWILFPIGIFPFVMILSTLIFFPASFHEKLLRRLSSILPGTKSPPASVQRIATPRYVTAFLVLFIVFQLLFPWRYLLYPGNLFWTEEGYRFSWRVMLMEKAGHVIFHVTDPETGRSGDVFPVDYLTPNQEKMMSTQPDMILQFAHYLDEIYQAKGISDPVITAEAYVTLNGSGSRLFIDPSTDLSREQDNFSHKSWIIPFDSVINYSKK